MPGSAKSMLVENLEADLPLPGGFFYGIYPGLNPLRWHTQPACRTLGHPKLFFHHKPGTFKPMAGVCSLHLCFQEAKQYLSTLKRNQCRSMRTIQRITLWQMMHHHAYTGTYTVLARSAKHHFHPHFQWRHY